jgi:hypothetical protein
VSQARECLKGASPKVTEPQEESADGKAGDTGTEESKKPKGEVRQVSHGKDVKVREMRIADTILNIIQDRGKRIGQSQRNKETGEPDDATSIKSGSEGGWEKRPKGPRSQPTRLQCSSSLSERTGYGALQSFETRP